MARRPVGARAPLRVVEQLDASPLPLDHVAKVSMVGGTLYLQRLERRAAAQRLLLRLSPESSLGIELHLPRANSHGPRAR